MVRDPPRARRALIFGGSPLLVTAELPVGLQDWADALRRQHYPAERNRLAAHVTMFHALPPSAEGEVRRLLGEMARQKPPEAEVTGLMDLGQGTAFTVDSPRMVAIHAELAERLHGLIQQRDDRPLRLHVTVQNKVPRAEAQALQAALAAEFKPRPFRFRGLALSHWRDELWQQAQLYSFRG
ncbi:2'-5' RNA ligase family protein [Novosphingobium sp. JCM 18896]|uniref:2'-5' RNA ligase family protein n=1 Tax=Novosphingobium sp. JCM 18896 TaxID=2989731 RepID=UPI0022233A04|nr:2'-5' RNA ligase family protein [Novosphingobium sp. JCM 18896]MCW1428126.1 2'-5' RNA ligase family protein [Novosphingobium sp. JCM 18896]